MPHLIERVRALDDVSAVQLLRHAGPILFADPAVRSLLAGRPAWGKRDLTDEEKRELLSSERSVMRARLFLELLALQSPFAEVLARALESLRGDRLVAEARLPRGLDHALAYLTNSVVAEEVSGTADRTETGAPFASIPDALPLPPPDVAYSARSAAGAGTFEHVREGEGSSHRAPAAADASPLPRDRRITGAGPAVPAVAHTAWPHLVCDAAVVIGTPFDLEIGLRAERDKQVGGTGALTLPAQGCTLDVEVMFDPAAFAMVEGARSFTLDVTAADPYPRRTVKLVALGGPDVPETRDLGVAYALGGRILGYASRTVRAVRSAADLGPAGQPAELFAGMDLAPFTAADAADLTIVIKRGDGGGGGRLVFTARSPLVACPATKEPLIEDLGSEPAQFLDHVIRTVNDSGTPLSLFTALWGLGRMSIAAKLPGTISNALRSVVAKVAPRPASVLIISDDPYVPWELAVLDPPLGVTAPARRASPFLGAQVALGRWILPRRNRPSPNPSRRHEVHEQVVVTAAYQGVPGWQRLEGAEKEGKDLLAAWPETSKPVQAAFEAVLDCLGGNPAADLLHFALHGQFDLGGHREGLVLIEKPVDETGAATAKFLRPEHVAARDIQRSPFVFLNVCQVGAGRVVLGDYAGMAAAFLFAGASAVVAPLWSIDDEDARKLALAFYEAAWKGEAPAELLRRQRARFTEEAARSRDPGAGTATHLAYQFFGHPRYILERRPPAPDGRP